MNKNDLVEELEFIYFLQQIQQAQQFSYNLYKNVSSLNEFRLAEPLVSKFNKIPGIISAPKMLVADFQFLKNHADEGILFAYENSLTILGKNFITPHFGLGFSPSDDQELKILSQIGFEIPFIFTLLFNANAVHHIHGQKLLMFSQKDALIEWFMKELDIHFEIKNSSLNGISHFCQEVAENLGCDPIINLGEEPLNRFENLKKSNESLPVYDLINQVHAEIQECFIPTLSSSQIQSVLEKWSKALESGLHIIYDILDYLKPIRDKYLNNQEPIKEDSSPFFESTTQKLEQELIYSPLIKNCIKIFERLNAHEKTKQQTSFDFLEKDQQNLLFLHNKIALYEFVNKQVKIHLKNCQKVIHELKSVEEPRKKVIKVSESMPSSSCDFTNQKYSLINPGLKIHYEEIFDNEHKLPLSHKTFHANGSTKSEIYHVEGLKHGPSFFYNSKGVLLAKGWFIHNQRMGINTQYYPEGQIFSLQNYKDNVLEGKQIYYYLDGTLKTVMYFCQGKLEGQATLYYPSGLYKRRLNFKEGRRHGIEEAWYPTGQKELEANYENNRPIGTIKNWYSNGQLAKQIIFQKLSSDEFDITLWNEEGQIVRSSASKPADSIENLVHQTQELKQLLDETTSKLIEAFEKKKDLTDD